MDHPLVLLISSLLALAAVGGIQAVQYDVTNSAMGTPGGTRFQNQVGIDYSRQQLDKASTFIWQTFRQAAADRKNYQQVSMSVDAQFPDNLRNAAAYAAGNSIHLNANYVQGYNGDVRTEVTGIIYHEMTHVWQWNGNGQPTPGGLIEGIADFVRLKAGLAPSHWVKAGEGDRWDQGYDVTAYFLDYCNGLRDGFVADLNSKLRTGYSANFFVELLGKTVDQLWSDYKSLKRN